MGRTAWGTAPHRGHRQVTVANGSRRAGLGVLQPKPDPGEGRRKGRARNSRVDRTLHTTGASASERLRSVPTASFTSSTDCSSVLLDWTGGPDPFPFHLTGGLGRSLPARILARPLFISGGQQRPGRDRETTFVTLPLFTSCVTPPASQDVETKRGFAGLLVSDVLLALAPPRPSGLDEQVAMLSPGPSGGRGWLQSSYTPTPCESLGFCFVATFQSALAGSLAAAEYAKTHLPEVLKQQLQTYEKEKENSLLSYQTILEQQVLSVDREILEKLSASYDEAGGRETEMVAGPHAGTLDRWLAGTLARWLAGVYTGIRRTTCLVALLSDKELTVANVGDSRGVLCDKDGNAIPLSHDHKPYQLKERKRIKKAGGFISFNGSWRVQGILAMSRSLGDYPLKNLNVLIPDPDVLTFDLDKLQPEFMILASDGLWDAFSNEEAVRFIKERLGEPHFGAKSIVLQSFYRGCPDNITVMVVKFKKSTAKTGEQ
ncbi:hypothetical protein P4O66_014021 [Electrophorus voltai]|uniref:PPM-type phosphatase domain-containing protein n=1 Tax=Electrophorus voltai TaxID=2609070 RepID=A0AAD8Z1A8_9TELE|nr:hypothetical protein P4O66_014021 [Electrophorus voltai]